MSTVLWGEELRRPAMCIRLVPAPGLAYRRTFEYQALSRLDSIALCPFCLVYQSIRLNNIFTGQTNVCYRFSGASWPTIVARCVSTARLPALVAIVSAKADDSSTRAEAAETHLLKAPHSHSGQVCDIGTCCPNNSKEFFGYCHYFKRGKFISS